MDKTYIVRNIIEDDYGCEEREEGVPLMSLCNIVSQESGFDEWIRVPDEMLLKMEIDEGSVVSDEFVSRFHK